MTFRIPGLAAVGLTALLAAPPAVAAPASAPPNDYTAKVLNLFGLRVMRERQTIWMEPNRWPLLSAIADEVRRINAWTGPIRVALNPNDGHAHYLSAFVPTWQGDDEAALAHLNRAVCLGYESPDLLQLRFVVRARVGDLDGALRDIEEATAQDPLRIEARGIGQLVQDPRAADRAIAVIDRLVPHQARRTADLYSQRALLQLVKGKPDLALQDWDRALAHKKSCEEALFHRAKYHQACDDLNAAQRDLDALVKAHPQLAYAYHARGHVWAKKQLYGFALGDFHQAVRLDPAAADCWGSLSLILATCPDDTVRDGRRAVEAARTALRLTKSDKPTYMVRLAIALAEAKDFDGALQELDQAEKTSGLPGRSGDEIDLLRQAFKNKVPVRSE